MNFLALLAASESHFAHISCPVFLGQSGEDEVVNPGDGERIYRKIRSDVKTLRHYDNSDHLLRLGEQRTEVFRDVSGFVDSLFQGTGNKMAAVKATLQDQRCHRTN